MFSIFVITSLSCEKNVNIFKCVPFREQWGLEVQKETKESQDFRYILQLL